MPRADDYAAYKTAGICASCGVKDAAWSKRLERRLVSCDACREAAKARQCRRAATMREEGRARHTAQVMAATKRALRERRCRSCRSHDPARKPQEGKTLCEVCLLKMADSRAKRKHANFIAQTRRKNGKANPYAH